MRAGGIGPSVRMPLRADAVMALRIDILALFVETFDAFCSTSIVGRSVQRGLVDVQRTNIRDFATDSYGTVDDAPFGGGVGMVMMYQPVFDAIAHVRSQHPTPGEVILLSPQGAPLKQATVEDLAGKCDAVAFPETYEKVKDRLKEENIVFLVGTVDRRRETPSIIVDDIIPIDQAVEQLTGSILLRLAAGGSGELLDKLRRTLRAHHGRCPVYVATRPSQRNDIVVTVRLDKHWHAAPSRDLVQELTELLGGQQYILLRPKPTRPNNGNRRSFSRAGNNQPSYAPRT